MLATAQATRQAMNYETLFKQIEGRSSAVAQTYGLQVATVIPAFGTCRSQI